MQIRWSVFSADQWDDRKNKECIRRQSFGKLKTCFFFVDFFSLCGAYSHKILLDPTDSYVYFWSVVQVDLPGSWGDVASMINAPEPSARHLPRGQKSAHTKTQFVVLTAPIFCLYLWLVNSALGKIFVSLPSPSPSPPPSLPPSLPPSSLSLPLSVVRRRTKASKQSQQQPTTKQVD